MPVTVYHNPRCSKSRQTLALLEERGVAYEIVEYLKHPPSADELAGIVGKLGLRPADIVRTGQAEWKELGIEVDEIGDRKLLELLADEPILIQRPIVVAGERARIGRPPEAVLEIVE
ncbi:MAG: arsenate reductase (glutaredoxin) [Wenzhouxiangellaceae bacterium]|nr:arsenate reductase (glutaredoxin) [Wenzhouxiangellaceae bacterium]